MNTCDIFGIDLSIQITSDDGEVQDTSLIGIAIRLVGNLTGPQIEVMNAEGLPYEFYTCWPCYLKAFGAKSKKDW